MGFLREGLHLPTFLLPLAIFLDGRVGQTGNVPELDELVVGTADQEAGIPRLGDLFDRFADVLSDAADHPVRKQVYGADGRFKMRLESR